MDSNVLPLMDWIDVVVSRRNSVLLQKPYSHFVKSWLCVPLQQLQQVVSKTHWVFRYAYGKAAALSAKAQTALAVPWEEGSLLMRAVPYRFETPRVAKDLCPHSTLPIHLVVAGIGNVRSRVLNKSRSQNLCRDFRL